MLLFSVIDLTFVLLLDHWVGSCYEAPGLNPEIGDLK
jgi:hypothetical protein